MIQMTRYIVQFLPQRAAEGDVHFLKAAADAKHRHAGCDRARNQGQCRLVAKRIV